MLSEHVVPPIEHGNQPVEHCLLGHRFPFAQVKRPRGGVSCTQQQLEKALGIANHPELSQKRGHARVFHPSVVGRPPGGVRRWVFSGAGSRCSTCR